MARPSGTSTGWIRRPRSRTGPLPLVIVAHDRHAEQARPRAGSAGRRSATAASAAVVAGERAGGEVAGDLAERGARAGCGLGVVVGRRRPRRRGDARQELAGEEADTTSPRPHADRRRPAGSAGRPRRWSASPGPAPSPDARRRFARRRGTGAGESADDRRTGQHVTGGAPPGTVVAGARRPSASGRCSAMTRQCARPGCSDAGRPPTVRLRLRRAAPCWLDDVVAEPHPRHYDLCRRHATAHDGAHGWELRDRAQRRSPRMLPRSRPDAPEPPDGSTRQGRLTGIFGRSLLRCGAMSPEIPRPLRPRRRAATAASAATGLAQVDDLACCSACSSASLLLSVAGQREQRAPTSPTATSSTSSAPNEVKTATYDNTNGHITGELNDGTKFTTTGPRPAARRRRRAVRRRRASSSSTPDVEHLGDAAAAAAAGRPARAASSCGCSAGPRARWAASCRSAGRKAKTYTHRATRAPPSPTSPATRA